MVLRCMLAVETQNVLLVDKMYMKSHAEDAGVQENNKYSVDQLDY